MISLAEVKAILTEQHSSFYGGVPGKDFRIAHIFNSYYGDPKDETYTNYVAYDLSQKWASPIAIGDYIVIRYGYPGTEEYDKHRKLDTTALADLVLFKYWDEVNQRYETWPLDVTKTGYNGTLWLKIFDEDDTSTNAGISYTLIASMTGDVPRFTSETIKIHADDELGPRVELDVTDWANPHLTFYMPYSYIVNADLGSTTPGEGVRYEWITKPDALHPDASIDTPYIKLLIPEAWDILAGKISLVKPQLKPFIEINRKPTNSSSELDSNTTKYVHFTIPKAQLIFLDIDKSKVGDRALDADLMPQLRIDGDGLDEDGNYHFMIDLPQSLVFLASEGVLVGPEDELKVDYDETDINHPKHTFYIPRGAKFFFGDSILGKKSEGTYTDEIIEGSGVGDYYIHATTGFIYHIDEINEDSATYTYVACIQKPLAEVEIAAMPAYKREGDSFVANTPSVSASYLDEEEETGEKIVFSLPSLPKFEAEYNSVESDEPGAINARPTDVNTFTFSFDIPKGAEGPAGSPLNIIASENVSTEDVSTIDDVGNYLTELGYNPSSGELIAVIYDNTSYWFYKPKNSDEWSYLTISGSIGSFLVNEYSEDKEKAYNTAYINKDIKEQKSWGRISDLEDDDSKLERLPVGYTELLYIESDGNLYINIDINPTRAMQMLLDIEPTVAGKNLTVPFWLAKSNNDEYKIFVYWMTVGIMVTTETSGLVDDAFINIGPTPRRIKILTNCQNLTISINEEDETDIEWLTNIEEVSVLSLLGSKVSKIKAKLYALEIEDSNITYQFVPCMNPDDEIGLYDISNNEFYKNSGTGTFIAGPKI